MGQDFNTYFWGTNGEPLGNYPGLLPLTLYQGMTIKIHGNPMLKVAEWKFIFDHESDFQGLNIYLEK